MPSGKGEVDDSLTRVGLRVRLDGLETKDRARIVTLLNFIGARECSNTLDADLVITGPHSAPPRREPTRPDGDGRRPAHLVVGQGGQFELPRDEVLLAETLLATFVSEDSGSKAVSDESARAGHESGQTCRKIAVATWGGSRDGQLVSAALASACRGALVDASGCAPTPILARRPELSGIRWADVSLEERAFPPELVDAFVHIGRMRVLGGDARGVARADDPRLSPVIKAIGFAGRSVVVDCGRWDGIAKDAPGQWDALMLYGGTSLEDTARLACSLSLWEPPCPCILIPQGNKIRQIKELFPTAHTISMRCALSRGGKGLLTELRRASGRHWAQLWQSTQHDAFEQQGGGI